MLFRAKYGHAFWNLAIASFNTIKRKYLWFPCDAASSEAVDLVLVLYCHQTHTSQVCSAPLADHDVLLMAGSHCIVLVNVRSQV